MSSKVAPRSARSQITPQKRWSAPPTEKGFDRAISTPDQINRDVRGLKLRQRVSIVLGDEVFREELEEVVGSVDMEKKTANLQGFRTYQDFLIPTCGFSGLGGVRVPIAPVANMRGVDGSRFSKEGKLLRCKVASVYRLADSFNWLTDMESNVLCTARATDDDYYYLTPPLGLLAGEVSAGCLYKMDQEGNTIEEGNTNLTVNKIALEIHSQVYGCKSDVNCVVVLCSTNVKAVSAMDCGVLPISHEAAAIGEVVYHTLGSIVLDKAEKEALTLKLSAVDKVLVLRNMGAVCVGKSVEEAFYNAFLLHKACENQVYAVRAGINNLIKLDDEVREKIYKSVQEGDDVNQNKRKVADVHFEAWMRMLDARGHKTGYEFSIQLSKQQTEEPTQSKAKSPAKSSSFRYGTPHETSKARSPVYRSHTTGHNYRTKIRWLNEPIKSTTYRPEPSLANDNKEEEEGLGQEKFSSQLVAVEDAVFAETQPEQETIPEPPTQEPSETHITETKETREEPSGQTVTVTTTTVTTEKSKEELHVPEDSPSSAEGGKRRKKVKKSRSFKDTMMQKLGMKKKHHSLEEGLEKKPE
ncbi:alpha-adducin isoform X3 [Nematostella vectensis]|nr:alpha-adducin isoform X3 [Nematostella vectensis]